MIKLIFCVMLCVLTANGLSPLPRLTCIQAITLPPEHDKFSIDDATSCIDDDFNQCYKITIGKAVYRGCDKSSGSVCDETKLASPNSVCSRCKTDGCNSGTRTSSTSMIMVVLPILTLFLKML